MAFIMQAIGHALAAAFGMTIFAATPVWNYTTVLNIIFLVVIAVLGWRFLRTGGPGMLRMMESPSTPAASHHDHHRHCQYVFKT